MNTLAHARTTALCLTLGMANVCWADTPPVVITIKRLSMDAALTMARAAIAECRKEGVQAGVTVMDRGGDTQAALRDDLAPDVALVLSAKKAYTAMSFMSATSALAGRFPMHSVAKDDSLIMGGGGLPIQAGGTLFGGIGVAGAPTGELDEQCAQAGIKAVLDELEMSGH